MTRAMCIILGLLAVSVSSALAADTLVATRTIPARSIIGPDDILLRDLNTAGGLDSPALVIGQEARVALYAGRPIRQGDIGPPAVVERNQIIQLVYNQGGIVISTEGRALDRAGPGDLIRVMNLASRSSVTARISPEGVGLVAY